MDLSDVICCGCGACESICPQKAIRYDYDKYGFLHPDLDENSCVDCGLCKKVCLNHGQPLVKPISPYISCFYAVNKNKDLRLKSTSGGVFRPIADVIIKGGGCVAGCVWDENMMPKHILSDKAEDIDKMMGTKYVQSSLSGCYEQIKYAISAGRRVLFTGVPCQTAAIKHFFGETDKIIFVTLICHGALARKIWRDYLDELEQKYNSRAMYCTMRGKEKGWQNFTFMIKFENGKVLKTFRYSDGDFLRCFTEGVFKGEHCLNCRHKGDNTVADIQLGDGWGENRFAKSMDDEMGISSVIVRSEKGQAIFDQVLDQFNTVEVPADVLLAAIPNIMKSAPKIEKRDEFYTDYISGKISISKLVHKYSIKTDLLSKIMRKIKWR